ncbi:tyrosine-type recombinase/integrase [Nocardioides ferulae]|uniref:tyrosine-type recombinase/integrase n=1 Tax=Nocardioides ferulae TaxID=2340821 RepID=UPI0013DDC7C8|nr:tyrosine-type recombinase/integrase [Nocardioides ferulae]
MTSEALPDSLAELVATAVHRDGGVSSSRARQLRWVAGELARFARGATDGALLPHAPAGWLDATLVAAYLAAADAGALRTRGAPARPSPDATRRVRRACLRLFAQAAGCADPVTDTVSLPVPRERVADTPARIALALWAGRASPAGARPGQVRAAAMAVLVHEAGLRSGELAALTPEDVDLAARTLDYQPRPPATRTPPPRVQVPLSHRACELLRRWLEVRAELVAQAPRTRSLWVSLRANHDGTGVRRPPGLPLRPTGVRRAHARAVAEANTALAGSPGFEPLPRTAGPLRSSPSVPDGSQGV